jgi:hypothetical protein
MRGLAIVEGSTDEWRSTHRPVAPSSSRAAAYRRLASVILRLDAASLTGDLRAERLARNRAQAA